MPYALCPMPYALCPMPYAQSYLIFLRKAIIPHVTEKGYICVTTFQNWYKLGEGIVLSTEFLKILLKNQP
jgi:hypothetical protein